MQEGLTGQGSAKGAGSTKQMGEEGEREIDS